MGDVERIVSGTARLTLGAPTGAVVLGALVEVPGAAVNALRARGLRRVLGSGARRLPGPRGRRDGEGGAHPDATFQNISECSNSTAYGCVVAYSSYDEPSGDDPGSSALFGTATAPGYEDAYLPSEPLVNGNILLPDGDLSLVLLGFTLPTVSAGFEEYPGALDGRCTYQGGSSWLQITGRERVANGS